ncbi:MAG: hypothetical protein HQK86_13550 [Nitrospinae bacterium]|nr:hypothetical protein [Nitrospinota bacterium]
MHKEDSKYLVIDASVFKAAGETSKNNDSKNCRDILTQVMKICHKVVVTDELSEEINNHSSRFSRKWRTAMTGKKKHKIIKLDSSNQKNLNSLIESSVKSEKQRMAMIKDAHLLNAASSEDKIIVSLDEEAKSNFQSIINRLKDYKEIMWVNPTINIEPTIEWLRKGAKPDKRLMLKS